MKLNKILIHSLSIIFSAHSYGQGSYNIKLNPTGGYAFNLLKSPSFYMNDTSELGRGDLWMNSAFIGNSLTASFSPGNKRHKIGIDVRNKFFLASGENFEAGEHRYGVNHKVVLQKGLTLSSKLSYTDFTRSGVDQDNLIGIPLSYKRWRLNERIDWKLSKKNHFIFNPLVESKFYSMEGFNRFTYFKYGGEVAYQRNWKLKKKVGLEFSGGVNQRRYFISKTEGDNSLNRDWLYFTGGVGLKFRLGETAKLYWNSTYTNRIDRSHDRLGFNQFTNGVRFEFRKGKWKINADLASTLRLYKTFEFSFTEAGDDGEEDEVIEGLLRFNYITYGIEASYAVNERLGLRCYLDNKSRISNADFETRRGARSYTLGEVGFGITWSLSGNTKKN